MSRTAASRARTRTAIGCLALAVAVLGAVLLGASVAQSASSSARPVVDVVPDGRAPSRAEADGGVTEADGVVPDGVTVFDHGYPAVANLDPALVQALRDAATDAADAGITFSITSGWRSPALQDRLLRDAISEYGSEAEAARWVATADTSAHVSGAAVDIDSVDAITWLSEYGAAYGLCQVYGNEPWHYELRPEAVESGCPSMFADPTQDPRMQQ